MLKGDTSFSFLDFAQALKRVNKKKVNSRNLIILVHLKVLQRNKLFYS